MSDIQEEQKRLYKRAEENDKEKWIDISKENRRLLKEIHNREINELQNRINKAIEYIERDVIKNVTSEIILEILKGDNK